ncbi:ATP-binding protein [Leptospira licerasiae]|uniref:ATP-binding protein n=1 Tax=Leptospira licerasiae TaxID=447106 RepID=UPI00301B670F
MKREISREDATPSKNVYRSIIADYDAETALCELIDNAIDIWSDKGKSFLLEISVIIDINQQTIVIKDNAGGIKLEEIDYIVSPGKSLNNPLNPIIGIFGVGSKRAVVAMSQHVTVKTRYKKQPTFSVEITEEWLEDSDWHFPVYQLPTNIEPGTTQIELTKLREPLGSIDVRNIRDHFCAVYAKYIKNKNIKISLNGTIINGISFDDKWSFNPTVPPKSFKNQITIDNEVIDFLITGGLITEGGDSGYGEYGVYVYCNDRLIARALKTFDVGFTKGKVGVPHGSISLARVIIEINGPAKLMPWNSSKSGIDTKHKLFILTRNSIIETIKHYASASRSLFPQREVAIKPFTQGSLKVEKIESVSQIVSSNLPPIPKSEKKGSEKIKKLNATLADAEPWVIGTYESVMVSEHLKVKNYETKNRIILILIDSSIEITFKDYLTYKVSTHYTNAQLTSIFEKRHLVIAEVKKHCLNLITPKEWTQLSYFYGLRCDLTHKRSSAAISDSDINKFIKLGKKIHHKLLGIQYPKID